MDGGADACKSTKTDMLVGTWMGGGVTPALIPESGRSFQDAGSQDRCGLAQRTVRKSHVCTFVVGE